MSGCGVGVRCRGAVSRCGGQRQVASPAVLGAIVGGVVGLILAPFVSLLSARPPLREGAEPLSLAMRCDSCRAPVALKDAVPLVSFALLRGRCRACAGRIARTDFLAEVASVVVASLIGWRVGLHAAVWAHLLLGAVLVVVVIVDFRLHKIPTRLVYPATAASVALLALASAHDGSWAAFRRAVLGALAASAFLWLLVLVAPSGMGDGDARLALLLGLFLGWQGWKHVYFGLLAGFLVGSLAGIGLMIARRGGRKMQIAFGPYLAVGALWVVLWPGVVSRVTG